MSYKVKINQAQFRQIQTFYFTVEVQFFTILYIIILLHLKYMNEYNTLVLCNIISL